mgnify:CR=1 FL=1
MSWPRSCARPPQDWTCGGERWMVQRTDCECCRAQAAPKSSCKHCVLHLGDHGAHTLQWRAKACPQPPGPSCCGATPSAYQPSLLFSIPYQHVLKPDDVCLGGRLGHRARVAAEHDKLYASLHPLIRRAAGVHDAHVDDSVCGWHTRLASACAGGLWPSWLFRAARTSSCCRCGCCLAS